MASALSLNLKEGVLLCRKPGKLPGDTIQESYSKEYGTDTIEIHKDAIKENDIVLLHDDLLATGGTMKLSYNLVKKFHSNKIYVNFIMEITDEGLHGREIFEEGTDVKALMTL
jgi:adenine phosphoribosyltransferase